MTPEETKSKDEFLAANVDFQKAIFQAMQNDGGINFAVPVVMLNCLLLQFDVLAGMLFEVEPKMKVDFWKKCTARMKESTSAATQNIIANPGKIVTN